MGLVNHNGFNVTEHGESIAWWKDDSPYANFVPGDAIPSFREFFLNSLGMWFDEETDRVVIDTSDQEGYFLVIHPKSGVVVKRRPGYHVEDYYQIAVDNYAKWVMVLKPKPLAGEVWKIEHRDGGATIAHAVPVGDEVLLYEVGTVDEPALLDIFPRTLITDSKGGVPEEGRTYSKKPTQIALEILSAAYGPGTEWEEPNEDGLEGFDLAQYEGAVEGDDIWKLIAKGIEEDRKHR